MDEQKTTLGERIRGMNDEEMAIAAGMALSSFCLRVRDRETFEELKPVIEAMGRIMAPHLRGMFGREAEEGAWALFNLVVVAEA